MDSDNRAYMPKSKSQSWATPWWLFDELDYEFGFTVDAAASRENCKLDRYWTEETNGLEKDWSGERVFVNPPFAVADLRQWVEKAYEETRKENTTVVMIVPVKSDQDWWHKYGVKSEVRFVRGRVTFQNAKGTYPGPVAVLVFAKNIEPSFKTMQVPRATKRNRNI